MTLFHSGSRTVIRTLLALTALVMWGVAAADPPARVARMANVGGAVSFSPAGEEDWVPATDNRPLITGDRVWADADARVELQIGTLAVRLGTQTSVVILNLDDRVAQFQLQQGVLNVRVRSLGPDEAIEVDTPLLAFSVRRPGVYRIDVDAATGVTGVAIGSGQGDAYGETTAYTIGERQWYRFSDAALRDYQYDALPPPDAFDAWTQALDRREDNAVAARYVSPEVIGYSDLDQYGTWSTVEGYGNVWVPTAVASDWAPYSDGHWAWIEPWGWTWVDAALWGFAPFHYGRWAYARDRWCWVPGPRRERAVYAPALVAFVGGDSFTVSVGGGGPARGIAWFPLAPGEVYRPSYRVSRNYFTRVNASNTNVTSVMITNVYNSPAAANTTYRNRNQRGAVTAMAAAQFAQSRPVQRSATPVARDAASTAPVTAVASIAPVRASVLGAGAAAGGAAAAVSRPPVATLRRPAVARIAPPPPPAPFSAREANLSKDPGRPAELGTAPAPRPSPNVASAIPTVKVIPPSVAGASPTLPAGPRVRTNTAPPVAGGASVATPKSGAPERPPARAPASPPNASPQPSPPARPPDARGGLAATPTSPGPNSGASAAPAPARPAAEQRREPRPAPPTPASNPDARHEPPPPAANRPPPPSPELRREPHVAPPAPAPDPEVRREGPPPPTGNRPPSASPELRREPPPGPSAKPAAVPPVPPQPDVRPAPPAAAVPPQARPAEPKAAPAKSDAQKAKPDDKREDPK